MSEEVSGGQMRAPVLCEGCINCIDYENLYRCYRYVFPMSGLYMRVASAYPLCQGTMFEEVA